MENQLKTETHPIEKAISEQARGFVPVEGLEKGLKGKCLTKHQIWVPRRRTEDILVDMVDELKTLEKADQGRPKKSRRRRRRRGPKVSAVRFF